MLEFPALFLPSFHQSEKMYMSSSENYLWKILRNLVEVYKVECGAFTRLRTSFNRSVMARKTGHDPHTIYLSRGTMASFYTPIIMIISPTTVHAFLPSVLHAQICCDQRSWLIPLLLNSLSKHSQVVRIWGVGSVVNNLPVSGDTVSIPESGRSPGEGNGSPLQYSCLRNPMDRRDWQATVYRPHGWLR